MGAGGRQLCETDCVQCTAKFDNSAPVSLPDAGENQQYSCGGCEKRQAWMNRIIPGSGDFVAAAARLTGMDKVAAKIGKRKSCDHCRDKLSQRE